jgi:radical SAM protein with 4Fe4S-binding SPASM domain
MGAVTSNFQEVAESPRLTRPLDKFAIQLTVYCNLKCKMCSVWEVRKHGVPLDLAKELLTDAYKLGARMFIPTGAESFMRKDFVEIVEYAHALGYWHQSIVTNGTMIDEEDLERLSRCPSIKLNISIDGPRDILDDLRGEGNFDKSVATARECIRRGIDVGLSGVILRETLPHVKALIDLAANVGVKGVSYQPFQTEISGLHKDVARFSLNSLEHDAIATALRELSEYAARRKISIYTEPLFGEVPDYLLYNKRPIPSGGCSLPSTMVLIDWRGNVYPCFFMMHDEDIIGNVYRSRLPEIWHSRAHKQLQMLALTERCPGCLAACSDVRTFAANAH